MSRPEPEVVLAAVRSVADAWEPIDVALPDGPSGDPLRWPGYDELRSHAVERSGRPAAMQASVGTREDGSHVVLVDGRFGHLGGSMGSREGAVVCSAYDRARDLAAPVVVLAASGGARMQEGMASLVQMTATVAAARAHADAGLLQVAVCNHPTTGGVFASHVNVADVRIALPRATIGFAGPRVAEAFTGEPVPAGSHTAEGALAAGLLDAVLDVDALGPWLDAVLGWAARISQEGGRAGPVEARSDAGGCGDAERAGDGDAWREVLAARADDRARAPAFLASLDVAAELRGDGAGGVDPCVRVALARTPAGTAVVVVAMDVTAPNGGTTTAAGYRLAWRGIALADRIGVPLVTLVDTPGADPSARSEAEGIAQHIAGSIDRLLAVDVPTVALVVGEGGSGGALALASCDRLLVQEHAVFSVIAPEGAAAILHRDRDRAPEVAALLDPTAHRLHALGIADEVVPEPDGAAVAAAWAVVDRHLAELAEHPADGRRVQERRRRWRERATPPWHPTA